MNSINHSESISKVTLKIITVSRAIGGVRKAKMTAGKQYQYFSNEAVLSAVSEAMEQNNLWVLPASNGVEVVEAEYLFHYLMTVVDADSGEYITLPFTQTIPRSDVGPNRELTARINDKASGIAHSYAHKTFLLKLFMISTPDADSEQQRVYDEQPHTYPVKNAAEIIPAPVEYRNSELLKQIQEVSGLLKSTPADKMQIIQDVILEIDSASDVKLDTSTGGAFKKSLDDAFEANDLKLILAQLQSKLPKAAPAKKDKTDPK